jgi:hypothetical protein
MKKNIVLILLPGLLLMSVIVNSCKKATQTSIQTLFTGGKWQLASITRYHFLNNSALKSDTLNTTCNTTQFFTFNTDNTSTYTNFDCITQTSTGQWALTPDQLFLNCNMVCQDTTAAKTSKPFLSAKIINLGQYSLILRTGQYGDYYPANQLVTYTDYGFVRQKSSVK